MSKGKRVLQFDFESIQEMPFSVYFLDDKGQVEPKRIFTVVDKRITEDSVDVFIYELGRFVIYHPERIMRVEFHGVN